jgi:hypothetical protein
VAKCWSGYEFEALLCSSAQFFRGLIYKKIAIDNINVLL